MFATKNTEFTEDFSFVGAALAANCSLKRAGLFAAKATPTFTVVQIKITKQVLASVLSAPLWQIFCIVSAQLDPLI
jgi:hypothetical protein